MQDIVHKKDKVYYSMGEVAEMFDVKPSLIRYWEQEFDILKPHRNNKGNRLFTPRDVDNLKVIYHLLKEKKMKIEVARKHLKENRSGVDRDSEIVERLLGIRAILLEIKQEMLGEGEIVSDDVEADIVTPARVKDTGEGGRVAAGIQRAAKSAGRVAETGLSAVSIGRAAGAGLSGNSEIFGADAVDELDIEVEAGVRPPFEEQMLFEVAAGIGGAAADAEFAEADLGDGVSDKDIDGYISAVEAFGKGPGYEPETDEEPTEAVAPKPAVIEQTLF